MSEILSNSNNLNIIEELINNYVSNNICDDNIINYMFSLYNDFNNTSNLELKNQIFNNINNLLINDNNNNIVSDNVNDDDDYNDNVDNVNASVNVNNNISASASVNDNVNNNVNDNVIVNASDNVNNVNDNVNNVNVNASVNASVNVNNNVNDNVNYNNINVSDIINTVYNNLNNISSENYLKKKIIDSNYLLAYERIPESLIKSNLIYIEGYLNDKKITIFIDTGAEFSVFNFDKVKELGLEYLIDTQYKGMAHGVGVQEIIGRIHYLELVIDNYLLPFGVSILKNFDIEADLLLGIDSLNSNGINIDFNNKCLIFNGKKIPFINKS